MAADGTVTQVEELETGSYVKVLDGASVSFGQVLYQKPVMSSQSSDEEAVETLDKPINSDQDGEVVLQEADAQNNCIEQGGMLVWVLQGTSLDFQHEGSTLAVKEGDAVEVGQALAQEWAATQHDGVPRFQEPPRSVIAEAFSLRTDFDFFELAAARTTEYITEPQMPSSLHEDCLCFMCILDNCRPGVSRALTAADEIRRASPAAPKSSNVFTQVWQDEQDAARRKLRVMCNPPSLQSGAAIFPTACNITAECVTPGGGLCLHVPREGGMAILWSPEESIRLLNEEQRKVCKEKSPIKLGRQLLFKRTSLSSTATVQREEDGVLVCRCKDRVYYSRDLEKLDLSADASWECAIKPGEILLAPSKHFTEGIWWDAAEGSQDGNGVYFYMRAVPPDHPVIPGLPMTKMASNWTIAQILDDPRGSDLVRLLLRRTRLFDLPAADHRLPSETDCGVRRAVGFGARSVCQCRHCISAVPDQLAEEAPCPPAVSLHGETLDVAREWGPSSLCVIQHSPLGDARAAAANSSWQEAEPRYITCGASDGVIARRMVPSKSSGIVCKAELRDESEEGPSRLTAVVLSDKDVLRVPCQAKPLIHLGDLVRQHDWLSSEDVSPAAGQVVSVQVDEDGHATVLLRRASSYLVTQKGSVMVRDGSVVRIGDCLATEPLAVPRTSDIVQGLPRIERLFEAANKQLEARLDKIFEEEAINRSSLDAAYAARRRFEQELLADIQSAYGEQGVDISSKHIEVVVRRMTEKCRIEEGISGLPPGTLMNYVELEGLCALQPSGEVRVRPVVRGVTEIGRDGSHMLVAMGFREVDNVVANEVCSGAGRFGMEGVKENLMIGKAVSVGSKTTSSADTMDCEIDLDGIPAWAEEASYR
ncbi:rpoC2 [Symbiodinium pilosum]|uniref:RpoC2 protein n=1 Tax=Symbiodinium pilosum TaxID=2952 RepID=A0A812Y237_SYMPI|nr:rpoC2 [Symbiodinium pilosum]